ADHTCALLAGGKERCWGKNALAQLGNAEIGGRSGALPVSGGCASVREVASGFSHTCDRDSGGRVRCWGDGSVGALGVPGLQGASASPVDVGGLGGAATSVSAGAGFSCAIRADGGGSCWGLGSAGQLGAGDFLSSPRPRPVASGSFVSLSAG